MSGLERQHYVLGFHTVSSTGGGQDRRVALFDSYASGLFHTFAGEFDLSIREAWAEANEIVEGPDVEWAYRRAAGASYHERLRDDVVVDAGSARTFYLARGSC